LVFGAWNLHDVALAAANNPLIHEDGEAAFVLHCNLGLDLSAQYTISVK
jgi:hypothetical protein